jgi:hypothetical protein
LGQLTEGLDEAGTGAFGVSALGAFGDLDEELVIQSAAGEAAIQQQAETENGGFEAEVVSGLTPVLAAVEHLEAGGIKGSDGLGGEAGGGEPDGGDVFARLMGCRWGAVRAELIPDNLMTCAADFWGGHVAGA